jgi:DNA gyrase/topoisomerase IV subunit A
MSHFGSEMVRLVYSVILVLLTCIGLFRLIRQAIDKGREAEERERMLIDDVVDNLPAVKAVGFALEPTKEGEKLGRKFIMLLEATKKTMKKLKEVFDKYKGYLLTVVLGVLTVIENYGGYINQLCGGSLVIKGVEVLPIVTLACTVVVGILSNGYTKEQREKIKALFSRSSTSELVHAEIKKSLKDNSTKLTQFNKILSTKETELENLQSELKGCENTYNAKKEMYVMIPQLATEEDVQLALNAVVEIKEKIDIKSTEIDDCKKTIVGLTTTINALKCQL